MQKNKILTIDIGSSRIKATLSDGLIYIIDRSDLKKGNSGLVQPTFDSA